MNKQTIQTISELVIAIVTGVVALISQIKDEKGE